MIRQLVALSLLVLAHGLPATYDQRQDGDYNIHAQLDNIMIVIATSGGPSSLFNDIASQILELKDLTSRNRKVSVADEEIVEQGKDPLSVKILRIEGEGAEENSSQSKESSQGEGVIEQNQRKALETPHVDDANVVQNSKDAGIESDELSQEGIPAFAKKTMSPENQQILEDLKISEKIDQLISKEAGKSESIKLETEPEKTKSSETEIQETAKLEKIPEKLISYGTIVSVDQLTGKVIYDSEKRKPGRLEDRKLGKISSQEKILLEKSIPQELATELISKSEEKKPEISETPEKILIEDPLIPGESQKEEFVKLEEKIDSDGEKIIRRVAKELRVAPGDSGYPKSRMSLKKELPRMDDNNEEEAGDKNEVRLFIDRVSQISQSKPIGDMIENCGPGRIRNQYGICQFDGSFN